MALGILLAVFLALHEAKRKKMHEDTVLDLCLIIIPFGVVGARLYYVLLELNRYIADPIKILYIWEGGLAIYGAVIGGLIGAVIYSLRKKIRFLKLADLVAPGLILAQGIGRWGNFFNQEAFGPAVTDPAMQWFPYAVRIDGLHFFDGVICNEPVHMATFFYESMWCFLVFLFLWFIVRKRVKHDGDLFFWYVLLYAFERMFLEGLRGDSLWLIKPSDGFTGIRASQLLSVLLFIAVLIFFIVRKAREKKEGRLMWPAPEESIEPALDEEKKEEGEVPAAEETGTEPEGLSEEAGPDTEAEREPETPKPDDPDANN
jgi:phosphatidylglycerol:prolipoprotein diacylglycerol transferase